jgi:hypothetical protein
MTGELVLVDHRQSIRRNPPLKNLETDMTGAIARLLPRSSATSIANIDTFVTVALLSGVGLLLSLSVLIFDQNIPGEWF